jgi:hypothetical protein
MNIFALLYTIIDMGVRLTLSTGALFQPSYQERTCAVSDIASLKNYENNYVVSEEWNPVFNKKEK